MPSKYTDLRTRLAEVDALIFEQERRLKALEETRSLIQSQLDLVVYPVLTLPAEITSQVFLHCLPPNSHDYPNLNEDDDPKLGPDPSYAPLLLLHVCRAWKAIAISTPRLWCDFHVDLDLLPEDFWDTGALFTFINTWFRRAGSCPLTFSVCGGDSDPHPPPVFDSVCDVLRSYNHRFRCLALQSEGGRFLNITTFPLLEKLRVGVPGLADVDEGDIVQYDLTAIAQSATHLRDLTLVQYVSPSVCVFPWEQLTAFTCESLTADELLQLLLKATSLTECVCACDFDEDDGVITTDQIIQHQNLQTLRLSPSTDVLQFLQLPALQNLDVSEAVDIDDDYFVPFLSRSAASLRRFSCGGADVASMKWFPILSGLTVLELHDPTANFLREFVQMLDRAKQKDFLPRLEVLLLEQCSQEVTAPFVQALSSRSTPSTGLARLELFRQMWPDRTSMSLHGPVVSALRALVASGMKVHVGSASKNLV
ncbi:hypothetical protein C8R43DRAFT_1051151 [Mycena crocata]|nr:hypothetical protein C8R43DRAFT_1051151 [Mycena crocata]